MRIERTASGVYVQWGETRVWLQPWSVKIQRESIVGPVTVWPKQ